MNIGGSAETEKKNKKETEATSGTKTSQLQLEDDAILKIIQDVLGSGQGLANIFAGEQVAGIFDSSVAAQASGDLAANIVGELAKITGKTVDTVDQETVTRTKEEQIAAEIHGNYGFGS